MVFKMTFLFITVPLFVQWNVTWQEIVSEMSSVLEAYANRRVTATQVVQNSNTAKTIFVFKKCDVLRITIVKVLKFVKRILSVR